MARARAEQKRLGKIEMKKIKVVFESDDGLTGYVISPEENTVSSGKFNKDLELEEVLQEGEIGDKAKLSRQISWVIRAALDG